MSLVGSHVLFNGCMTIVADRLKMITDRIPDTAPKKKLIPRNDFDVANPAACLSDIEMAVFSINSRVIWNEANNKHVKENRNRNTHKIMLRRGLRKFESIFGFNLLIQFSDSESLILR